MTADLTRRNAIRLAANIATAFYLSQISGARADDTPVSCFIGQSGDPKSGSLCLGILVTADYERHRQAIQDLRGRMKHRRTLKPSSRDRYGALFCKHFLDYMLADADLHFIAVQISLPTWPDAAIERDKIVFGYHVTALNLADGRNVAEIDLVESRTLRSVRLARSLASYKDPRPSILTQHSKDEDLLQLAAYLASVVRTRGGRVKQSIRTHLTEKLAVNELDQTSLKTHPKFRVREIFG